MSNAENRLRMLNLDWDRINLARQRGRDARREDGTTDRQPEPLEAPIDGLREAAISAVGEAVDYLDWGGAERAADAILSLLQSRQANGAGSAEGWRDIATAPRDGSEILLLSDEVVHHGCWQGPSDGAIYSGSTSRFNWFSRTCGQSLHDDGVTHWAPLALTPASAGEEP